MKLKNKQFAKNANATTANATTANATTANATTTNATTANVAPLSEFPEFPKKIDIPMNSGKLATPETSKFSATIAIPEKFKNAEKVENVTESRKLLKAPIMVVGIIPKLSIALLDIKEKSNIVLEYNDTQRIYGWVVLALFLNGKYKNTVEKILVTSVENDVLVKARNLERNNENGKLTFVSFENGVIRANCGTYVDYRDYNHILTADTIKLA